MINSLLKVYVVLPKAIFKISEMLKMHLIVNIMLKLFYVGR